MKVPSTYYVSTSITDTRKSAFNKKKLNKKQTEKRQRQIERIHSACREQDRTIEKLIESSYFL